MIEGTFSADSRFLHVSALRSKQKGDSGQPAFRYRKLPPIEFTYIAANEIRHNLPPYDRIDIAFFTDTRLCLQQKLTSGVYRQVPRHEVLRSQTRRKVP